MILHPHRQQIWQRHQRALGLCVLCNRPVTRRIVKSTGKNKPYRICAYHRAMQKERNRKKTVDTHATV